MQCVADFSAFSGPKDRMSDAMQALHPETVLNYFS